MYTILFTIIAVTAIVSYIGFTNNSFFEKYKFNVGAIQKGEFIRIISAGFLHADWMHLFFNMLTLYFFAPLVIAVFGVLPFLIIYFGAIIVGNLFSLFLYKSQPWYSAIGASGGVSGVLFAAVALDPSGISVNFLPGYIFGAVYFGYSVYMMLNPRYNDNTGHAAHIGGAIVGLIAAVALFPSEALKHSLQLLIMSLPLIFLAFKLIVKK